MLEVCDFQVIGEMRDDPNCLLLLGTDGQCYAYDITNGEIVPLELDDSWAVDIGDHRLPARNHPSRSVAA
jgi:hypothetical protein